MGWFSKGTTENLTETVLTEAASLRHDPEQGIFYGAKIRGRESKNGVTYAPQTDIDGVRLYEGAEVNIDHPPSGQESKSRALGEGWGVVRNVKVDPRGGNIGDLHYLKEHRDTPLILERHAKGLPIGLSHNVKGSVVMRGGKRICESIQHVNSIDLVRRPGATENLFESEQDMTTLAEFVESIKADHPADADLLEAIAAHPVAGAAPMAAPQQPENQVKSALVAALHALAETADEATLKKTIGALMSAAKPAEVKPADDAGLKEAIAEAVKSAVGEATKPLLEQITELQRAALIRNVMESHGITAAGIGPERLKTLTEAVDEPAMKTLIESWPPAVRAQVKQGFAAATQLTEQVAAVPNSSASVRQLLRSR